MKINPKQLEKMAKKMGIQSEQIDAEVVIIRTPDKDLIIHSPSVARVNMMGQDTFQVSGEVEESDREDFSDDDVEMVAEKAGVSTEKARDALRKYGGIAEAIIGLKKDT